MKISIAQTKPFKGDIPRNIEAHKKLINQAVSYEADLIIFPELSLTGYEPSLAKSLAIDYNDSLLNDFQQLSNDNRIAIGVGLPTKNDSGVLISMVLFQPHNPRDVYSKQFVHPDELPYFIEGDKQVILNIANHKIALVICYELSVEEHLKQAISESADMYLASVAKTEDGVAQANKRLSDAARECNIFTAMANSIGSADDFQCAGRSAVWNKEGLMIGQLNDTTEGILVFDTETQEVF